MSRLPALSVLLLFAAPVPVEAQLERAVLEAPSAVVEMRSAALLMSGQEGGDLDLVVRAFWGAAMQAEAGVDEAGVDESEDGLHTVLVVVEVDGLGVLEAVAGGASGAAGAASGAGLEIFVYAVGPSLDVRDAVTLRLDEPASFEAQLLDAGVRVLAPLRLDSGPQDVRILARVGDRFGLRKFQIEEPAPPAFDISDLDSSGRWLVTWSRQRPADDPELRLSFQPAVSQPRALVLEGSAEAASEPWPTAMRRLGGDVFTGALPDFGDAGRDDLRLPEELGRHLEAVLAGYYDAVALRAEGKTAEAARLLAELEAGAMEELGEGGLELLLGQEVRGYERIRRKLDDVRPLIGLIRLHLDAADEHRRYGRFRLASFSIATAVRLSEWYADEADDAKDGDVLEGEVASILASLAGAMQIRGPLADAVALYRQALQHAPDDRVALFGLATVLSKVGEAKEAAEIYGRLVGVAPDYHEARLRWAVMLQRSGKPRDLDEARRQYRRLMSGQGPEAVSEDGNTSPVPEWVGSLAAQQLIRMAFDTGRTAEASEVLDAALVRWPDHGPLRVASLRWAELQGDAEAVTERLRRLDPAESGAPALLPGERTRFHEAPHPDLDDLGRRLAGLEASRWPELAQAVAASRGRRGSRR